MHNGTQYAGTNEEYTTTSGAAANTTYFYCATHDKWETGNSITVIFKANGGTGADYTQTFCPSGGNLLKNTFEKEGYEFKEWNTKADGTGDVYADEAEVQFTTFTTLYAQWTKGHEHDYEETWTWTGNDQSGYTGASVHLVCKTDSSHTEDLTATVTSSSNPATCTAAGNTTYTATATDAQGKVHTATKEVVIPALGHAYGEPTYTWTADYSKVTAETICANDAGHTVTEQVNTISAITTPATCEGEGTRTYTANFTNAMFSTQTKEVAIPATGHAYGEPEYVWAEDNSSVTATSVCANDSSHTETETVNTTYAITADPTCEGTGVGTYTATFTNTRFSTQTRNVDIAATGHHYEFTKWEWTGSDEDGYTKAEVILTCKNNTDHIVRVNADITKESTDADCTTPGTVVYTAAAEFEGQKYNDSKTVTSAALGHDYELKEWIWNGFESASAKFVCANDPTHIVTVEATITSKTVNATCTEDGSVVYTAKVTFEEKEYSDDKTEVLPKLGHQYEKGEWTWEGYTKASLQFVCEHNPEHVQNVSATITSERTEPTCTEDGTVVYTAKVTFEGKDYTDSKTEVLPKLNHDYELTGWEWTEFSAAKATFTCKNNPSHTVVEDAVITSRTQDPECEKAGATVYTATVSFNEKTYTDERSVSIPATGHDYEVSEWIWSGNETEGYHTASAVLVCKNDQTHTKTVAASLELDTKEATCTEAGYTIYTATAEEGEKTFTDEKTVNHPALGHAYKLTKWEWEGSDEEGYTSATATFVCEHDDKHVETVKDEEIDITVDEDGVIEYKAIVTFEEKDYSDVKSVKTDELEHDYEVVDWEWTGSDADGYTAAKVNLVCKNNPLHTKTLDAVVSHDTQDPSCTEDGKTVYTATAVYAGKTYTDTKEVAIAATGHDYVLTGWNWEEDFSAASVTFTCKNDAAHKQTVNAEITLKRTEPDCETDGKIVYTAKAVFEGKEYGDTREKTLPALGHAYEFKGFTWNGYESASAKFVCGHDESHVQEVSAAITSATTKPTCTEDGTVVYTAKVTFEGKDYTDSKTEVLPALGHKYEKGEWTWEGYTKASLQFVCEHNPEHVQNVSATITSERTEPTCTEDGKVVYTAKVTFEGKDYTDSKTEVLPALGHKYEKGEWTWEGYTKASLQFVC
ncbi:MAG: InlB B-repeat-containing protein, partial [Erysipelotrichales bacterium]|nr:InlB B-repeat-containing protein [Erysipelotrichales bacterium]